MIAEWQGMPEQASCVCTNPYNWYCQNSSLFPRLQSAPVDFHKDKCRGLMVLKHKLILWLHLLWTLDLITCYSNALYNDVVLCVNSVQRWIVTKWVFFCPHNVDSVTTLEKTSTFRPYLMKEQTIHKHVGTQSERRK